MIRLGLIGLGRTGQEIARNIIEHPRLELVMAIVRPTSPKNGLDIGDLLNIRPQGVIIQGSNQLSTELLRTKPDIVIDFTSPEACIKNAKICALNKRDMIIGTTGFSHDQLNYLKTLALNHKVSIVYAPNLSTGVNVLLHLVKAAATLLPGWDIEVIETHHRYKKDAPSGTAQKIAEELAHQVGLPPETSLIYSRKGIGERKKGEITIHAIRGGGVVGIHQVVFISDNEKLEIKHESLSRKVFADCVVTIIEFLKKTKPGYYTVEEALGLTNPDIFEEEVIG